MSTQRVNTNNSNLKYNSSPDDKLAYLSTLSLIYILWHKHNIKSGKKLKKSFQIKKKTKHLTQ